MPLYGFRCTWCDHTEDRIRKHDVKEIECEMCSAVSERQLSAPGYIHGGSYDKNRDLANQNVEAFEKKTGMTLGGA